MAIPGGHITPVWPPSGIALAALLVRGQRLWPGIWLGSFAANILDFYGSPANLATELAVSATYGMGASFTALWGTQLLRRFVDKRNPLERVPDVCAFMLLGGAVSCLVSATIGVTTLDLAGYAPWSGYGQAWLTWWLGDIGGVFIVAPLLLVWGGANHRVAASRWVELLSGFGLLVAAACYVFIESTTTLFQDQRFTFILVPFLIWAAVRFGPRGAASAAGLVALVAVWGTIHGSGPFNVGTRNQSLLALELFLSVISFTALCLAAMVTERRRAERKRRELLDELESRVAERTASLERAQEQYRSIFNNAVDGIFRTSPDGQFLVANPAAARIFGFDSPEELIKERRDIARQGYVDPRRREEFKRLLQEQGAVNGFEYEAYRKDGSRVWICENTRAVHSSTGEILYFEGIFEDVTDRKRAEDALRESEERFRTIFEQAPLGISEGEIATARFINANQRYVDILGYTFNELRKLSFKDYSHPEDLEKDLVQFQKLAAGEIRSYAMEKRYLRKDGAVIWVNLTVSSVARPGEKPLTCIAVIDDITDRIQAEEALSAEALRYKTLMETSTDSIYVLDKKGDLREANAAFLRRRGYTTAEVKSLNVADWDAQWSREELQERLRKLVGNSAVFETRHRCKDESVFNVEVSVTSVLIGGEQLFFCITRDISERKQAEDRLRRSEEKFKALFDLAPVGVAFLDSRLNIVDCNPALGRMSRLSRKELLGGAWQRRTFLNADGSPRLPGERVTERAVSEKRFVNGVETGAVMESGDIVWAKVSVAPLAVPDASAVVIMQDITERKQTEQAQERGLSLMLATLESTADGILVVNTDGKIVAFNRLFAQMWRLPEEVLASKEDARALECVLDQLTEPEKFLEKVYYLYRHPEEESFDRLLFKDGRVFERYSRPQLIGGEVAGRVWSFRDVTERKRAQAALRESQERFRLLAEVTNDAIWDWDLITNELWWNEGFETLFGYSRAEIEKTIDSWYNRVHPAERNRVISGIHRTINEGGTMWSDEYRFLCKDGSYAYVLDRGHVIRNTEGKAVRMVGGMRDLTERNKAEKAAQAFPGELLRAQDEERRRIAREIHDSTAQELAVVAMNLGRLEEWIEGRDPWAENLLADSLAVLTQGNRDLRTLAHLLHPPMLEELGLIGAIRDYVEGFSARSGIRVELEFSEDFERCPGETETALFRVVQESLSNVHRHSESKFALVRLTRSGDIIELTIADRGRGLPAGLLTGTAEDARIGVGISGMRQRIVQLQGRLDITSNKEGTTVRAVLPCSQKAVLTLNGLKE